MAAPPVPDPLGVIQAAYRLGDPIEHWLDHMVGAIANALGTEPLGFGALYDATRSDWIDIPFVHNRGLPAEFVRLLFSQEVVPAGPATPAETAHALVNLYRRGLFGSMSEFVVPLIPAYDGLLRHFEIGDLTGIISSDPTFRGCVIGVASERRRYSARNRYLWRKLSAHVCAGLRLQRFLAPLLEARPDPTAHAEAVLTPEQKVEHATGEAASADGREALRDALVRIDAARRFEDNERAAAIDLWTGLVAGRWSLVEHFERSGRRYFLAYRNDPDVAKIRSLTSRELQVWSYAAMGHSNKLIAYALGISLSAVASHLRHARGKLGRIAPEQLHSLLAPSASGEAESR